MGDGVTDDTEAIYAAIQAAEDGELFFTKGTYRISRSIDIELSEHGPLVIRGVSGASTVVMDVKGAAFIIRGYDRHMLIESSHNIVIQGNVFDHNADYFMGEVTHEGGIRLMACRDIIFSNNILEGINRGNNERGLRLK